MLITVRADYTMTAEVVDWDENYLASFDASWPQFTGTRFKSTIVPTLQSGVRGSVNASGSLSGTLDFRPDGGCVYTFKAYRRFKYN